MGTFTLAGKDYVLAVDGRGQPTRVRRRTQEQFAPAQRQEGRRTLTSVDSKDVYAFGVPSLGLGLNRIRDVNDAAQFLRAWDLDLETRFPGQCTLPTLNSEATDPSNPSGWVLGAMKAGVVHNGVEFGFWSAKETTDTDFRVYSFSRSGASWNNNPVHVAGGTTTFSDPITVCDAETHGTGRFVLFVAGDDHLIYTSTGDANGAYSDVTGTGWPTSLLSNNVTWDEDIDAGLLLNMVDALVAFLWDEDNAQIDVLKTTDSGTNWTPVVSIPSQNGPTGKAVYFNSAGTACACVGTREGVWAVDIDNDTAEMILDLRQQANDDNCRRMTTWRNILYAPTGDGGLTRLHWNGSSFDEPESVGPDQDDGLPSDRQGHATYLFPTTKWLFMAYGGHASDTYASILALDRSGAWHSYHKRDTDDQEIDWFSILTNTLNMSVRTGTNTSDMRRMVKPLTNPASDPTIPKKDTGYLIGPKFNGGFTSKAAWLEAEIEADGLSADTTGEYVSFEYGLDGDAPTTNDLGDFTSDGKTLAFKDGSGNEVGVEGVSIQWKLTFNRDSGDNTDSPQLHQTVISFLKRPAVKYRFEADVDLKQTADARAGGNVTTIVKELEALLPDTQITLVPLAYGVDEESPASRAVSANVIVERVLFAEDVGPDGSAVTPPVRSGTARLIMREV